MAGVTPILTNALSRWLTLNRTTINGLAKKLNVSPHTIKNMVRGTTTTVSRDILQKLSQATGLNYEQLIDPPRHYDSPHLSGDGRIDVMLGSIARYLHAKEMATQCRKYFSLDFKCSGKVYNLNNRRPVNFDEMCSLNTLQPSDVNSLITSVSWYNPDCAERKSTTLHTYWLKTSRAERAYIQPLSDDDQVSNETFVVLELEKSIDDMSPVETPKIKSWWWDIMNLTDQTRSRHKHDHIALDRPDEKSA